MINLKAQLWALVVSYFCFYSSSILAQTTNPWENSEYEDLNTLADILISDGFNFDAYFYSEGYTTGSDGTLGNENVCIRDDTRQVYIGRSDVCADRQMEGYDYIFLDQIDLSKLGHTTQTTSLYKPDELYSTKDLLGNTSQDWSGCFSVNQGWGGVSGGTCPTINDNFNGQINYGYVQQTLTNTAAIDIALKNAGLETTGYTYSWNVKNKDANYPNENNPGRADPFSVTIKVYDENNKPVFEKTYDYSQTMDWTRFSGSEQFENPFDLDTIDSIQLSITGYDIGYWAGYYGPEFSEPDIRLQYRLKEDTGPSPEEILFEQQCLADPTSDPTCTGYNDAIIAQMSQQSIVPDDGLGSTFDVNTGIPTVDNTGSNNDGSDSVNTGIPDPTGETVADGSNIDSTGVPNSTGLEDTTDSVSTGVSDPVAEATEEVVESADAKSTSESKEGNKPTVNGLSVAQNAEAEGNAVAGSAVVLATEAATTSLNGDIAISTATNQQSQQQASNSNGGMSGGSSVNGSSNGSSNFSNGSSENFGDSTFADSDTLMSLSNTLANNNSNISNSNFDNQSLSDAQSQFDSGVELASLDQRIIDDVINSTINNIIQNQTNDENSSSDDSSDDGQLTAEEEEALVAAAQSGDDSEDAQAALLGYNPNFRAYQAPQLPDSQFYQPKEIYGGQENYDNPNQRFFNGASDATHREMVRQQYKR
jgi:hypothetical protein